MIQHEVRAAKDDIARTQKHPFRRCAFLYACWIEKRSGLLPVAHRAMPALCLDEGGVATPCAFDLGVALAALGVALSALGVALPAGRSCLTLSTFPCLGPGMCFRPIECDAP